MNWEQVKGIIERVLTIVATYIVAKGYVTTEIAGQIVTAFLAVGSVIWALFINTKTAIVQTATALPEVDSRKMAAAIDDPSLKATAAAGGATADK